MNQPEPTPTTTGPPVVGTQAVNGTASVGVGTHAPGTLPKTGPDASVALWGALLVAAGLFAAVMFIVLRRRSAHR